MGSLEIFGGNSLQVNYVCRSSVCEELFIQSMGNNNILPCKIVKILST